MKVKYIPPEALETVDNTLEFLLSAENREKVNAYMSSDETELILSNRRLTFDPKFRVIYIENAEDGTVGRYGYDTLRMLMWELDMGVRSRI